MYYDDVKDERETDSLFFLLQKSWRVYVHEQYDCQDQASDSHAGYDDVLQQVFEVGSFRSLFVLNI